MSQRKPQECTRRPIEPLAVLPLFYDLQDQPVLFAGNGEGAAWKLQLLLAAGAQVHLCTPELGADMIAAMDSPTGCVLHDARTWLPKDFAGKRLAIGAFDDDEAAQAFAAAARAQGTPVNVIDNKPLCDFQFGSIVNRSPVVVSISTAGAAPALGQAIRIRIETLLPRSLSAWGEAARKARKSLSRRLPSVATRKEAWRAFAEAAFTRPGEEASAFFDRLGRGQAAEGSVTLVGAGPGAADLLTLRAVRAMQAADVILFDDLVSADVLDLARREAKRMLVGKRGKRASCRQEDINALMIKLGKQGKKIVRLKSGDPMIFGRAGEEMDALAEEGIRVDVVPGITSALAAASSLGVSLTHRDCAQAVKFVTGHSRKGELPDLDWRACADPATTLMIYMGGRTVAALAKKLIGEGLGPQTPVVICESVAKPEAHTTTTHLGGLLDRAGVPEGPVLIGIGQVFAEASAQALPSPIGAETESQVEVLCAASA